MVASFGIGVPASVLPFVMGRFLPLFGVRFATGMLISLALILLWVSRFVFALLQHRRNGLRFLMGLPFIVLAGWAFVIWWACAVSGNCYFM
jgi:hypothetical protein